jgi:SM-20-related protein
VTAILYLNPAWTPADGGQLRIYSDPDPENAPTDIPPLSDRLVVFLSDRIEHEVLPSSTPRYALTAWYLR